MKLGIIGKPQAGKTTVFNAACGQQENVGDFSKAVHRALVTVPDERLEVLAGLVSPKKITYAQIEFVDAPGFSGKGKDARAFEIHEDLRQADAFLMVVDAFSEDSSPESDVQSLIDEMILLDQTLVESTIDKRSRKAKLTGDKSETRKLEVLARCLEVLEQEKPLLECDLAPDEEKLLRGYQFLSQKPLLVVINIGEDEIDKAQSVYDKYSRFVEEGKRELAVICGRIEMELVGLEDEERTEFLKDLGIEKPAVEKVIEKSYFLLGLISYLTAAEPEVRAWTIERGDTAQKAAGVIHSDIERGFIRAEVTAYNDYIEYKTLPAIKAAGKQRLEGKEYIVADGDVILFRFNV
ncbi:MAG: redox-regulated ATPase YchF [bacterium]|nr:redox-regulated ATPase YchF [bacterium]